MRKLYTKSTIQGRHPSTGHDVGHRKQLLRGAHSTSILRKLYEMYKGACNALLHDLGGTRLPPHEGGGGGGGDVGLLEVGGLLEHLGGETEDAHLVPLCDNGSLECAE